MPVCVTKKMNYMLKHEVSAPRRLQTSLKPLELTTVVRVCITVRVIGSLTFSWLYLQLVAQSDLPTTRAKWLRVSGAQSFGSHPFALGLKTNV